MMRLEDVTPGIRLYGIVPNQYVEVVNTQWRGDVLQVFYKRSTGETGEELLMRDAEADLEPVEEDAGWHFDADGHDLRLVSEAKRIGLAHLFDPKLAVHTSLIEPLPHQIIAVYEEMLPRQPLRFLLADDPGAGKTVMAGLLTKELVIRDDVNRCLIVVPGNLVEQWQDEMWEKFQLPFDIMTRDMIETARTGNPFAEHDFLIARLDQVSRDDILKEKLGQTEWDLVIVDEAHKMSASFFGKELNETKRHKLGKLLGQVTRHYLLMTATPHNGKEADFQLFMRLLDPDRFEGCFREGVHQSDASDLMRRMIKEDLKTFEGKRLFPERYSYTLQYDLSEEEAALYEAVSAYVREQFNLADQLEGNGRRGTVGFALTVLQRRLASSPAAIHQSLKRRHERLKKRAGELRRVADGETINGDGRGFDEDDWDTYFDLPDEEAEDLEAEVIDQATAARTLPDLEEEIDILDGLARQAWRVKQSGKDRKWEELSSLLNSEAMFDPERGRRKLVIFSEHRDTVDYLTERIGTLLGRDDAIVTITGGMRREQRHAAEQAFRNDPDVTILLATDAAGEGINLQRAHLMVNYDLPWNPNRLEQRFGRIHRIGQREVCTLWNLVAYNTREGAVYYRLLDKLQTERHALQDKVFDVLGSLLSDRPLHQLLVEAIRYGDQPEVRARLEHAIDEAVDVDRIRELLEQESLARDTLNTEKIEHVRADMERAAAQRLQPHYIQSFFLEAFKRLGGTAYEREPGRFRLKHVPQAIRKRAQLAGPRAALASKYDRVCFEKEKVDVAGKPAAEFVAPGHPLLDATIALIQERHQVAMEQGAVLIDAQDTASTAPRVLFYLQHDVLDARAESRRDTPLSRRMHFVEVGPDEVRLGGTAPYLDYQPVSAEDADVIRERLDMRWLDGRKAENRALDYAIAHLVPAHKQEIVERREARIEKTKAAVHHRLKREIHYWDRRAAELQEKARDGKPNAALNAQKADARARELAERLERRMELLEQERRISAPAPVAVGRALIVPAGLLAEPEAEAEFTADAAARAHVEARAMDAVMEAERALGHTPTDVSMHNLGYDVESVDAETGRLRFIEVKGRHAGAPIVTLSRNELHTAVNEPEKFILAVVLVDGDAVDGPHYVRQAFSREPDFGVTSVNYSLRDLLGQAEPPG